MTKQYIPVTPVHGSVRAAQNTRTHKPRVRVRSDGAGIDTSPMNYIIILTSLVLPAIFLEERFKATT